MTLDVGPFLETLAPISILATLAFGIAKVIVTQQEHGRQFKEHVGVQEKKWEQFNTKLDALTDQHRGLESRVLEAEMYERGLADAAARKRVTRARSNKRRSKP